MSISDQDTSYSVPLDYFNASAGNASLALARYIVPNREQRLGTIFFNPGGPGGSGTALIHLAGKQIAGLVGGRYDIVSVIYTGLVCIHRGIEVSWDPRGVNMTRLVYYF